MGGRSVDFPTRGKNSHLECIFPPAGSETDIGLDSPAVVVASVLHELIDDRHLPAVTHQAMRCHAKDDEELLLRVLCDSGLEFFNGVVDLLLGWLIELVFLHIRWQAHIGYIVIFQCIQYVIDVLPARREVLDSLHDLDHSGVLALPGLHSLVCRAILGHCEPDDDFVIRNERFVPVFVGLTLWSCHLLKF